jgi:hypothetical protein
MPADLSARLREALKQSTDLSEVGLIVGCEALDDIIMAALAPVVEDAEREQATRAELKAVLANRREDRLREQVAVLTAERDRLREALDRAGLQ